MAAPLPLPRLVASNPRTPKPHRTVPDDALTVLREHADGPRPDLVVDHRCLEPLDAGCSVSDHLADDLIERILVTTNLPSVVTTEEVSSDG